MEATGIYTVPVYQALIEQGHCEQVLVCDTVHVKTYLAAKRTRSMPWLAELLESGLLRSGFIPETKIKAVRDIMRYYKKIVGAHTSELQ
jgi:hypothetical protein